MSYRSFFLVCLSGLLSAAGVTGAKVRPGSTPEAADLVEYLKSL